MNVKTIDRVLDLAERLVKLAEVRWTPIPEVTQDAEVWKTGDPKKAETRGQYRDLPADGPGRFTALVEKPKP